MHLSSLCQTWLNLKTRTVSATENRISCLTTASQTITVSQAVSQTTVISVMCTCKICMCVKLKLTEEIQRCSEKNQQKKRFGSNGGEGDEKGRHPLLAGIHNTLPTPTGGRGAQLKRHPPTHQLTNTSENMKEKISGAFHTRNIALPLKTTNPLLPPPPPPWGRSHQKEAPTILKKPPPPIPSTKKGLGLPQQLCTATERAPTALHTAKCPHIP